VVGSNEWIFGGYAFTAGKHIIFAEHEAKEIDPATIGQCTGLRDKNGTLIFEGDILAAQIGRIRHIGYVEYDERIASFRAVISKEEGCFLFMDVFRVKNRGVDITIKKIGNIHDNKLEDFS
jgi:uncharacterized phage protein (TIGR01671 family)